MTLIDLLTQTAIADTDLLRKSNELGDAFAAPREVDFAFESAERDNAEDFAEFVNGKQYGVAVVREPDIMWNLGKIASPSCWLAAAAPTAWVSRPHSGLLRPECQAGFRSHLRSCYNHGFEFRHRHDGGVDNLLPMRVECLHL
jgi:hypothetical protein